MEDNDLWNFTHYEGVSQQIRRRFLEAPLSDGLIGQLRRLIAVIDKPLAVRSSGLFEDMLIVPFSGIYDTYIIPNANPDAETRLRQLCDAVRLIYASLFSESSRAYFESANYKLEEERMAVVVQELVGERHGGFFYPHIAGMAQSHNYYPVAYLKPDDGLCVACMGLGSYVVEGGEAFRFSPRYPKLDLVSEAHQLSSSQRWFYALDLDRAEIDLSLGEDATLSVLDISQAESNPAFRLVASTLDLADGRLVPGTRVHGPRVINFANILKHDSVPLASLIDLVLEVGERSMGIPVEIEYAVNLSESSRKPTLYLLQIKPLVQNANKVEIDIAGVDRSSCVLMSPFAMGNGREGRLYDILFVKPGSLDLGKTQDIAAEIGSLNAALKDENRKYVLVGFGRWGTRDHRLGVPVAFSQISNARAIVEADLEHFRVDSSLGSHFFHNVTAMNIGYFSIPWNSSDAFIDWDWLSSVAPYRETAHCALLRFDRPLELLMDGRNSRALVKKPVAALTGNEKNDTIACTDS